MEINLKDELVKELLNVAEKMKHEPNPIKKVFYYSAAYGIVDRTMRYDFSKDLLLTYTVLNVTYNSYTERIKALRTGDQVVPLAVEQLDKVSDLVKDLAGALRDKGDITGILMDLNLLAYMATGPGHYMATNGSFNGMI